MALEDPAARLRYGRPGVKKTGFCLGEADSCTNFAGELWAEEGMGTWHLFSKQDFCCVPGALERHCAANCRTKTSSVCPAQL